jgi:deoxyribodipyrimidine photo-lyase
MSPWAQSARFDADGVYVHRWVSELAGVAAKDVARWGEPKVRERALAAAGAPVEYPAPMFHWKERAAAAIAAWRDAGRA